MDDFKGTDQVTVRRGDVNVPVRLHLKACSASTKNDGSMPFGSSVLSSSVSAAYAQTGTDATTALIASTTNSGNTVIAYVTPSSTLPLGLYKLKAAVTMTLQGASTNSTRNYRFNRVKLKK